MEELIESYGELIRTLNRISNNNKDVLLQCDIKRIEKAKTILPKYSESGAQLERSLNEQSNRLLTINESIAILKKVLSKCTTFDSEEEKTDFVLDLVDGYKRELK